MYIGKEEYVIIKESAIFFIVYFTARVNWEGKLNFRKDLYERNKCLASIILENAAQ